MIRCLFAGVVLCAAGCSGSPSPQERELSRVELQLAVLYRPLVALVEESRLSVQDFLRKEGRQQILPTDRSLTDAELARWIAKAEGDLMPRNERMCALIRAHRDLVDGPALPASWQALLDHVDGWREDHERWRKEGVAYPFHARTSFPRTLERELRATIARLEARRDVLRKA